MKERRCCDMEWSAIPFSATSALFCTRIHSAPAGRQVGDMGACHHQILEC